MSRGMGRVERSIVDLFAKYPDAWGDSIMIAAMCLGVHEITASQHTSFRRALRKLERAGRLADMGRGWPNGRRRWALTPEVANEDWGGLRSDRAIARAFNVSPRTVARARKG